MEDNNSQGTNEYDTYSSYPASRSESGNQGYLYPQNGQYEASSNAVPQPKGLAIAALVLGLAGIVLLLAGNIPPMVLLSASSSPEMQEKLSNNGTASIIVTPYGTWAFIATFTSVMFCIVAIFLGGMALYRKQPKSAAITGMIFAILSLMLTLPLAMATLETLMDLDCTGGC